MSQAADQHASLPRSQKKAAVIKYDPERDRAPRVVAHGRGLVAERLIEEAAKAELPMTQDPLLVEALLHIDLGSEVPPQLYQVIAEVLLLLQRAQREEEVKQLLSEMNTFTEPSR
ncbi:EscU/YscU/HrcU family type III secretion system export apparatus switch protein [Rubeoparvulum massiliense]|uniref:EscU/YscU/HrcU family type III secretion system export apparatus switch protein n=1 Tax=Rubeoparvulum massiliense TaxID=1631346 RepID=UPI00065E67EE|nr:EscU/YscU/HrcU family type III secretion system export apparatus switch protein [Rubeoparvulum massiliense]